MAKLRWSLTAGNDLRDIEDFIARDSVLHAVTCVDRVIETAERVLSTPNLGRIVPEFKRKNLREIIFRGYALSICSGTRKTSFFASCMVHEICVTLRIGSRGIFLPRLLGLLSG